MKLILLGLFLLVSTQAFSQVRGPRYNPPGRPQPGYQQPGYQYPQPVSYCSQYQVGDYIYVYHGAYKTAQITQIRGCSAYIEFYGNWNGSYNVDLNDSIVSLQNRTQTNPRTPRYEERCSSFYEGDYIYVYHGQAKTAQIVQIRGCSAVIEFYGNWSGSYTMDLNDSSISLQR